MDEYKVSFTRSAHKELEALDPPLLARIAPKIDALAQDPRPVGCRKLQGDHLLWRIRIGDYRVVYAVQSSERIVDIVAVRHRSDAYR